MTRPRHRQRSRRRRRRPTPLDSAAGRRTAPSLRPCPAREVATASAAKTTSAGVTKEALGARGWRRRGEVVVEGQVEQEVEGVPPAGGGGG
ncbi:hypothetical protein ACHAWF_016150, partial [Thalassiosira exigua]